MLSIMGFGVGKKRRRRELRVLKHPVKISKEEAAAEKRKKKKTTRHGSAIAIIFFSSLVFILQTIQLTQQ